MNIVKLHRFSGKVSYLACDEFDDQPHPPVTSTVKLSLRSLRLDYYDHSETENPILLDQKDRMVTNDYPLHGKFERLSRQEMKHAVLDEDTDILSKRQWKARLETLGFQHRGHRLIVRK